MNEVSFCLWLGNRVNSFTEYAYEILYPRTVTVSKISERNSPASYPSTLYSFISHPELFTEIQIQLSKNQRTFANTNGLK